MKTMIIAAISSLVTLPAFATVGTCDQFGNCEPVAVPEISALEGTAALAVLATIVLLAWERRRRAA